MLNNKNSGWYLLFIAYIISLFSTAIPLADFHFNQIGDNLIFLVIVTAINSIIFLIINHLGGIRINYRWWLMTVVVVFLGFHYYYWRLPHPQPTDISYQLTKIAKPWQTEVNITGKILTAPAVNSSHRAKFELQALTFSQDESDIIPVSGKVYVTAPLLTANNIYPTETISLTGKLYQPPRQLNFGGFDFANYLARKGIFTGFSANDIEVISEGNILPRWLVQLRQRVIKTHVKYLKIEMGTLVSSMTIGNRGVDIPNDLLQSFRDTGLAHVISASGFHVSLLLTAILTLTRSQSPRIKLIFGLIGLLIYTSLTGFYPSVLRATLMGVAVLIGIVNDRRVKVSASLLLVAIILLIINPLWIWDLGFQFSFLATWGLIANSSAITRRLDWMPTNIANLIAVPVVATIWVLPLQCFVFKGFSPYCIITNILTIVLVILISLTGIISGIIGIFSPAIGSYFTVLLIPVVTLLIKIVNFFSQLPYSWFAVGKIPLIFVLLIYSFLFLFTFSVWWQKKWLNFSLLLLSIIIISLAYQRINLVQITVLKSSPQPSIVIQNHWQTGVINLNDKSNIRFNLAPFLNIQGINSINFVYSEKESKSNFSLNYFAHKFNLQEIIDHQNTNSSNLVDNLKFYKVAENKNIISFNFHNLNWLIVNDKPQAINSLIQADVLIYSGSNLSLENLEKIKPKVVIIDSFSTLPEHQQYFQEKQIAVYNVETDGAIQWQLNQGFRAYQTDYDKI